MGMLEIYTLPYNFWPNLCNYFFKRRGWKVVVEKLSEELEGGNSDNPYKNMHITVILPKLGKAKTLGKDVPNNKVVPRNFIKIS